MRKEIRKPHKHGRFSVLPSRILYDSRLNDKWDKHVRLLSLIGVYDDKDGWCYPSLDTLSDIIGTSKQTVVNWSNDLAAWGYLSIAHRKNGKENASNLYKVLHDNQLPNEFDLSKTHTGDLDTVSKRHTEDLDTVSKTSAQNLTERPIECPIERPISAQSAPPPSEYPPIQETVHTLKDDEQLAADRAVFDALPSASAGLPPLPTDLPAGVACPQIAQREYTRRAGRAFAQALQRGSVTDLDRVKARHAFDQHFPIEQLEQYCNWAQSVNRYRANGKTPNAGWIWNDLDEWRARGYPGLAAPPTAPPEGAGYGYARELT